MPFSVALLAEGVDRNVGLANDGELAAVALLAEGVDRNSLVFSDYAIYNRWSPSSRRAWIEIVSSKVRTMELYTSPSSRRAWIEI